jgi:hypothetical protein
VWNGRTGELIAAMGVGAELSARATELPGQPTAVVPARNGTVYRLDTRFSTWIDFACAIAGRNLSPQEWTDAFGDRPYHATCPVG